MFRVNHATDAVSATSNQIFQRFRLIAIEDVDPVRPRRFILIMERNLSAERSHSMHSSRGIRWVPALRRAIALVTECTARDREIALSLRVTESWQDLDSRLLQHLLKLLLEAIILLVAKLRDFLRIF